jgi:hypothetical protein
MPRSEGRWSTLEDAVLLYASVQGNGDARCTQLLYSLAGTNRDELSITNRRSAWKRRHPAAYSKETRTWNTEYVYAYLDNLRQGVHLSLEQLVMLTASIDGYE